MNESELVIDKMEQQIKNEIDLRIEDLKSQLDNARGGLFSQVKKGCDELRK